MKTIRFLLMALLLGGCVNGVRTAPPLQVYDFGSSPMATPSSSGLGGGLALEVRAASWLDSPSITYRLDYSQPLARFQYADSRWAAAPAALLAQHWQRQLGVPGVSGVSTACVLRVELQEFAHVFADPQHSVGRLQGQVSVIDSGRRPLVEHALFVEQAAATADAPGGVRALALAGQEGGRQIATWLDEMRRSGRLAACGLPA